MFLATVYRMTPRLEKQNANRLSDDNNCNKFYKTYHRTASHGPHFGLHESGHPFTAFLKVRVHICYTDNEALSQVHGKRNFERGFETVYLLL